jgi:hypothetical protein
MARLRERAARGDYDRIVSTTELARVVTDAMREVSHTQQVWQALGR